MSPDFVSLTIAFFAAPGCKMKFDVVGPTPPLERREALAVLGIEFPPTVAVEKIRLQHAILHHDILSRQETLTIVSSRPGARGMRGSRTISLATLVSRRSAK